MGRLMVLVVVVLLLVGAVGTVLLGAFPPTPRTEAIQRVLPNDRFAPR